MGNSDERDYLEEEYNGREAEEEFQRELADQNAKSDVLGKILILLERLEKTKLDKIYKSLQVDEILDMLYLEISDEKPEPPEAEISDEEWKTGEEEHYRKTGLSSPDAGKLF